MSKSPSQPLSKPRVKFRRTPELTMAEPKANQCRTSRVKPLSKPRDDALLLVSVTHTPGTAVYHTYVARTARSPTTVTTTTAANFLFLFLLLSCSFVFLLFVFFSFLFVFVVFDLLVLVLVLSISLFVLLLVLKLMSMLILFCFYSCSLF